MDGNVLSIGPTARADLTEVMCAQQGETFADHSGGRVKFADQFHPFGGVAGLFLQFANGSGSGVFARRAVIVADQAGRQF